MKNIIVLLIMLPLLSCSSNSPLFGGGEDKPTNENINYVKIQKQIQTSYALLKALNSGVITQEEYDKLKVELFNI